MSDDLTGNELEVFASTTEIVSARVKRSDLSADEIVSFFKKVYQGLHEVLQAEIANNQDQEPFVPVEKSVTPDYLICLEDGKKMKMLRRYLRTNFDMTPDEYREKWGLPPDYPMTAPNYAKKRSSLAKDIGLGKKSKKSKK